MGITASTAFIWLLPLMAFVSALTLFWLIKEVTGNDQTAAVGTVIILLCGRLVSENPFVSEQLYGTFAFLRRYIPAVAFPFFLAFCGCAWRAFIQESRLSRLWALAAGLSFSVLVYSYFYLWTAAAAWLFCLTLISLISRPLEYKQLLGTVSILAIIPVLSLALYFRLLSLRASTVDANQALAFTHAPDLFRLTEIVGALTLLALSIAAIRKKTDWRSPTVLFAATCAVVPLVVFNQQILTGRTLQPFHYEQFIVNYVVLLGLVITYHVLWQHLKIRPLVWIAFALAVGLTSSVKEARDRTATNVQRDRAEKVFKRLNELSGKEGRQGLALFNQSLLAASAQTVGLVPQLWTPNLYTFGYTTPDDQLERLYQYLYYLSVNPHDLENDLKTNAQLRAAVFGLHRANSVLSSTFQPVSLEEIQAQARSYSRYIEQFSAERARKWPLAFVITVDDDLYDLSNLDRWYIRDKGEVVGGSVIYTVRLRGES